MTKRVLKKRTAPVKEETAEVTEEAPPPAPMTEAEKRRAETDALLDDIEEVLEENAEQFVADFVQKSGE